MCFGPPAIHVLGTWWTPSICKCLFSVLSTWVISWIIFSPPTSFPETLVIQILYHIKFFPLVSDRAFLVFWFYFIGYRLNFIFYSFNWICYASYLKILWIFLFMLPYLWFHKYSSFSCSSMILIMYIWKIFTVHFLFWVVPLFPTRPQAFLFAWYTSFLSFIKKWLSNVWWSLAVGLYLRVRC